MGADAKLMKELNKRQLRRILRQCKEATKPELADRTGLSVVTINSLLEDLLKTGEVVQSGLAPSGGGRPSTRYQYRPDYRYAVLLYGHQSEGRNLMHLAVVNLMGECVWRKEEYFDEILLESFEAVLDDVIGRFPEIGLLAFGLPGEVVDDVVTIHDYQALVGPEFMAHYKERYHLPVVFENDINAMTYGACREGDVEKATVAGIYLPRIYPPGAGLVIQGKIYYGTSHCAGELAGLPVPVSWDSLDYGRENDVLENLKLLTAVYGFTVAPETLIFYGDFFTEELQEQLRAYSGRLLEGKFHMDLIFAENLERDYEEGMKRLALEALWEEMELR